MDLLYEDKDPKNIDPKDLENDIPDHKDYELMQSMISSFVPVKPIFALPKPYKPMKPPKRAKFNQS